MKVPALGALALCASIAVASPPPNSSFQIIEQSDAHGLTLQNFSDSHDMEMILVAPDGSRHAETFTGSESVYLDVVSEDMPDGLYRYELRPVARVKRAAGEIPDHMRGLTPNNDVQVSTVSGSFRVVNGSVTDSLLQEGLDGALEATKR